MSAGENGLQVTFEGAFEDARPRGELLEFQLLGGVFGVVIVVGTDESVRRSVQPGTVVY